MVEKKKKTNKNAEDVARIFVENMKANMENPDFFLEKERRMEDALHKVIEKRKEREEKQKEQDEKESEDSI